MKDTVYYDNPDYKLGNHEYHTYFCKGMRGRGKSTYWLGALTARALKDVQDNPDHVTHRFVYLRRTDVELQKVLSTGLYNSVLKVWKNLASFTEMCDRGKIYMCDSEGAHYLVGYYLDLNKVKSISIEDADCLLFDEIVASKRSDYKGGNGGVNEPEILARLDDTLFRGRENWHIYLGNADTPTDPYSENWHIPYGAPKWKDKKRGLWYEFDKTDAAVKYRDKTVTGKRWLGTEYDEYAKGEKALGEVDSELILERPKHSVQLYNLRVAGEKLTVWYDHNTGVVYITDSCAFNPQLPIYACFNADMSVNSNFINYCSEFRMWLRHKYGQSAIRFNSQKTFSLLLTVMGLD